MGKPGRTAGYREIEHTADKALEVWAPDLSALFEQAALGMFSLMADLERLRPANEHVIELEVTDLETGLIDWLSELLYQREIQGELYCRFRVTLAQDRLVGLFAGQPAEPSGAVVKAATYHNLHVVQDEQGWWTATVVFDT